MSFGEVRAGLSGLGVYVLPASSSSDRSRERGRPSLCTQCGAPWSERRERCAYCGVRVIPRIGEMLFTEDDPCEVCGRPLETDKLYGDGTVVAVYRFCQCGRRPRREVRR